MKRTWREVLLGRKKVSWKKRLAFWGTFLGLLVGGYYWQPQRIEFFPPQPPVLARTTASSLGLFEEGKRVLVVTGHPDDNEFYNGGTMLQLAASGAKIRLVAMTDGDKAYYPFGVEKDLTRTRRKEQRAAAAIWKGEVHFLGYMDGRLPVNDETVADLVEEMRDFRPDVVMTFDPVYRPRITHSDHIDAGRNTLRAIKVWGEPCQVLLFNTRAPNLFVDIEKDWFGKQELLKVHASQFHDERLYRITAFLADKAIEEGKKAGQGMSESYRTYRVGG